MSLLSWAAQRTALCDSDTCGPPAGILAKRSCTYSGRVNGSHGLVGYCPMIWANGVVIDGAMVGTAVADGNDFRFFAADVRLDELDGLTWPTLPELRFGILVARSLILAELRRNALPE